MSKKTDKFIDNSSERLKLAEEEYLFTLIKTGSFFLAEKSYRESLGDLRAGIPSEVEAKGIAARRQHLSVVDPTIRKMKHEEMKEFNLIHLHYRRLLLVDTVAEQGIPDRVSLDSLRETESSDLKDIVAGLEKLQAIRRNIYGVDSE